MLSPIRLTRFNLVAAIMTTMLITPRIILATAHVEFEFPYDEEILAVISAYIKKELHMPETEFAANMAWCEMGADIVANSGRPICL